MREAKLVNSKSSKPQETCAQQMPAEQTTTTPDPAPVASTSDVYQPKFEDINLYLSSEEVKYLENIVESYWKAYR